MAVTRMPPSRRSRRLRRLVPLLVLAAGAFAGGLVAGGRHEPAERRLAARFASAWERGGIAAVRPKTGEVLALSGVAFSAPQPPGSVFKIITLSGALDAGVVKRNESFPVQTAATLEGTRLENAN